MTTKTKSVIDVAKDFAIECHYNANQMYGGYLPYAFHLRMVVGVAHRYKHLVPEERFDAIVMACWLHDALEDCPISYNDIKDICGKEVSDLVFAVTNEKGKTRKERAGDKYYEGIRNTPYATFVKLCDRIANIEYGKMTEWEGGKMLDMYRKENDHFTNQLHDPQYNPMFNHIIQLLEK